jgi:hypothetical protein
VLVHPAGGETASNGDPQHHQAQHFVTPEKARVKKISQEDLRSRKKYHADENNE